MELREYTDFNQEEILSLYTSVGWENYTRNPQMLERAYENSFLKIAAFEGKQLIGMVRVVGDGASVRIYWCIRNINERASGVN